MQDYNATVVDDERDNDINLTPMLDVVFIMLIFFIVTASFVKEAGIDVNRPEADTSIVQKDGNILIAISENNEIWIGERLIDPRALRANLLRLRAEYPDGKVVIQADEHSYNDTLVQVMDAARQGGIFDISLAANKR